MNHDDAKNILRLYRPQSADAEDPQIAEALALAAQDPELAQWLERHCARQTEARQKFRQITPPAGLMEQIVSEHNSRAKIIYWRQRTLLLAAAAMVAILVGMPFWLRPQLEKEDVSFTGYQTQMTAIALRGYGMDVFTNDPVQIHGYLAQNRAPADYVLPVSLQKATMTGCAIENWGGAKVSMICFRTGQPAANGAQSDLWLFVIEQSSVNGAPAGGNPQLAKISQMTLATWNQGGKLYLLGTTADEAVLRKFL